MNARLLALVVCIGVTPASLADRDRLPAPLTDADFHHQDASETLVELGRLLFHDKILSGNRNISCASCHHAMAGTGDGLALPIGEGGAGLGITRDTGSAADAVHERVPRNAPPVFNLGARQFVSMFHDGRVETDPSAPGGFRSPAGSDLPSGLDTALAVQAMFPVTSGAEMAGQAGENPQADAAAAGDLPAIWEMIAARLRDLPEYVALFETAFDDIATASDVTYAHAARAIAAFESVQWRFDDSPFDRFLRGDRRALSGEAKRGMRLFYGRAGCSGCHAGALQTDHGYHAIAMAQIGPGKGDGADGNEDFGRERVTGDRADRYRFRTPTLRNVAISGPWGHAGAFDTLRAVVEHHFDPVGSLAAYDIGQAALPSRPDLDALDGAAMSDPAVVASIAAANELVPPRRAPSERDLGSIMAFLHALTDPRALDMRRDVPRRVPSGLPIFD